MGFKILVRSAPSLFLDTLVNSFEDQPYILLAPSSAELNWSDAKAVESYIRKKSPSIIVNHPLVPLQGNSAELKCLNKLIQQCQASDIPLIHLSSYRVFGELNNEVDLVESYEPEPAASDAPANHLLAMEKCYQDIGKHIILRLSWMLNGESDNVIERLIPALLHDESERLAVSDHAFGNPIQIQFAVHVVFSMIQQILCGAGNWGVFHVHSSDTCSEAEFCDNLVRLLKTELNRDVSLPTVASADDERKLMPGNANLQGRRCTDNFGIQLPSWRKGLKALIKAYLEKNQFLEPVQ
ncbi:dTDP-4-dehydrorhamnose reductase [Thalassocella blandensis]|nr:dTDP-4-dehydrorhamnose reductase [Thalassocella blandensis]